MMKPLLILFVAALLFSCTRPSSKPKEIQKHRVVEDRPALDDGQPPEKDSVLTAAYTIYHFSAPEVAERGSYTFRACKLYASPDSGSAVIRSLGAFVPVRYLKTLQHDFQDTIHNPNGEPGISYRVTVFHEVKIGGSKGYLRQDDLAHLALKDVSQGALYLFGTYQRNPNDTSSFLIKKIQLATNKQIGQAAMEQNMEGALNIYLIKGQVLKNVNRMIKIVSHHDYCGGGEFEKYFAETNNRFVRLPGSYTSFDDGGGVDTRLVYLPHRDKKGKQVWKTDTLGHQDDTVRTMRAAQQGIPANELIVETRLEGQYLMDDNNEMVKNKKGRYKMETPLKLTTLYYRWNGTALSLLPGRRTMKAGAKYN